jgi:hypothetical protein
MYDTVSNRIFIKIIHVPYGELLDALLVGGDE